MEAMSLSGKVVLVTGGTVSFGNKFVEIALKEHAPKVIRVFSRDELKQFEMSREFRDDERLRFFIGDVRDAKRISRAMNSVDIVVHAAALKQVPACEYNPIEAVKTNINGAINVIDAAIDNGTEKVIALSTDKAVHPVNLYGATKLVAEKLFIQGNAYVGERGTRFSCVRYGNVVGSRGSVIPLFLAQREQGVITMTDKRMTRFWITLEQGVRFVIACLERMSGGEVFVPKIPSMKLIELTDVIAPGVKKEFIGIRPGEKIHEALIIEEEARHTKEFTDYYVIEPEHPFWSRDNYEDGKELPDGFQYTSDTNKHWLTPEELREFVKELL
jgi:UDP-N-acetylglucosamine 4,6-dehydratase (inverting)